MAKKRARTKPKQTGAPPVTSDTSVKLAAARKELRSLRELKALQRTITRAIMADEVGRIDVARLLCAGTAFGVFGLAEMATVQQQRREAIDEAVSLRADIDRLAARLNPETV